MNYLSIFVCLVLWLPIPGMLISETLEDAVSVDIRDYVLDDFSLVEAAFILSGVENPDSLQVYLSWYGRLVEKVRAIPFDPDDRPGNASKVFNYLHGTWLKKYQLEATTLLDVVHKKLFNCVSATILYNLVCTDMGWDTDAFETPTHVYTIFNNFTQEHMVENTSPMGFDIMRNLQAYTRYIAHYYPRSEVVRIGLDRLYYHEQSKGRRIDNTELLGLLAYNQAYFANKRGDFARAYDLILLAQDFNRDSRSNSRLEQGLYYRWGKKLYDQNRYLDAFAVLADGAYRYPDDPGLSDNTKAAFFKAMIDLRKAGNWPATQQLVLELVELEILDKTGRENLLKMVQGWRFYLQETGRNPEAEEALYLIDTIKAGTS